MKKYGLSEYSDIEIEVLAYNSEDITKKELPNETAHIYPLGKDKAGKFEYEIKATDQVLVDNEYVKVVYVGSEEDEDDGYSANIYIVNKTDTQITVDATNVSINGYMTDPSYMESVDAGKSAFTTMNWLSSNLEEAQTDKSSISNIEIERSPEIVKIIIHTAKPGFVIGKQGAEIEKLKLEIAKLTTKKVLVDIKEIKRPDRDAQLVAESIAAQLESRISFRRAMKSTMSRSMKAGVLGIKASCSGRLGGADMARTEFYSEGTIPLQTLRADIEYGFAEADTTYGKVGVKVWIYIGEVLPTKANKEGSER